MGASLEKRVFRAPERKRGADPATLARSQMPGAAVRDVRFVPARWLALLLAIVRLLFNGRKVSKLGLAGLVWAYTPRTLMIVAAGLALAATIVLVGALAAITLLALQLI